MEYDFYIGGTPRRNQNKVEIINPYDGTVTGTTFWASREDAEEAVTQAQKGFELSRKLPAYERAAICKQVAARLKEQKEELARLITGENGKPIKDALVEVERAAFTFELAGDEALRFGGEVIPVEVNPLAQGRIGFYQRFPAGILLGIAPFNFPLNLAAHKVAPALAIGNPVILKPAPATPLIALRLAELILETSWPKEALSVFLCDNEVTGRLVEDDRIAVVSFTGSDRVGWEIRKRAGKKKVILELGGNAGVIVERDADVVYAARRCALGGFAYSGQVCISTQRIFVQNQIYDQFRDLLIGEVQKLKMGNPSDEGVSVGPLINEGSARRIEGWIRDAKKSGGVILTGGGRQGSFIAPTVLENVKQDCAVCTEEAFGPVVVLEPFDRFEEAIARVNDSRYGLQCGVFSSSLARAMEAFRSLEVGGVIINDVPGFRVDNMPYGGVKDSGFGREGVRFTMEEMSEIRMMVMKG